MCQTEELGELVYDKLPFSTINDTQLQHVM